MLLLLGLFQATSVLARSDDLIQHDIEAQIAKSTMQPLFDAAIERKIRKIVKTNERFRVAGMVVRVNNGKVFLKSSFLDFRDPSMLKHKVAAIESVVAIKISPAFLVGPGEAEPKGAQG